MKYHSLVAYAVLSVGFHSIFGYNLLRDLIEDVGGKYLMGIRFTNFNVTSPMLCAHECSKRRMCLVFGQTRHKCGFIERIEGGFEKNTCIEVRSSISKYPRAIAGACSDHKCTKAQTCHPVEEGGHTCKNDLGIKR